jgi:uncharacterized phage protein gp47/JayE
MAGLTQFGFQRKTLPEILASMKQNLRSKLGEDWNVETGSIEDQFISVFAEEADQGWQGLEGIYSSQTLDGAEGIYLDDVLSRQGVYRQGRTASSGRGVVFSNYATVAVGNTINTTATVSASNTLTYNVSSQVTIDNYVSCYKLAASQLSIGVTYTLSSYNTRSPNNKTFIWTPVTESDKDAMLRGFVNFINDSISDKPNQAYYNAQTRTAHIGFNSNTNLPQPFDKGTLYVSATPRVGSLGHVIELRSETLGFNPLAPNGLISLSPTYTGYESVVNGDDFNAGSEVQTDAEYRLSAINIKDSSLAGTPDSIISNLLRIEGVVDAEVYENPTSQFIYDVSGNTVVDPFTYNVAVLGGDDNEVAQAILDRGYGNTRRYGTYTASAINTKGQSVVVNFTRVGYFDIEVEVSYKAKDNTPLTETEKNSIIRNLATTASELKIGDVVPRSLMEAVTFQSVAFSRLSQVSVRLKDLTLINSQFTSEDIAADYDEKPRVLLDKVIFKRI